jgi:hypothetical protein
MFSGCGATRQQPIIVLSNVAGICWFDLGCNCHLKFRLPLVTFSLRSAELKYIEIIAILEKNNRSIHSILRSTTLSICHGQASHGDSESFDAQILFRIPSPCKGSLAEPPSTCDAEQCGHACQIEWESHCYSEGTDTAFCLDSCHLKPVFFESPTPARHSSVQLVFQHEMTAQSAGHYWNLPEFDDVGVAHPAAKGELVMRHEAVPGPVYGFGGCRHPIRLPSIATSPDFGRTSRVAWTTEREREAMEAAVAAAAGERGAEIRTRLRFSSADRFGCGLSKDDALWNGLALRSQTDFGLRGVAQATSRDAGTALADDASPDYEDPALAAEGVSDGSAWNALDDELCQMMYPALSVGALLT